MLLALSAALSDGNLPPDFGPIKRPPPKTKKTIPPGAHEFHFSESGQILPTKGDQVFFSCIARNEKNAHRKFLNHCRHSQD